MKIEFLVGIYQEVPTQEPMDSAISQNLFSNTLGSRAIDSLKEEPFGCLFSLFIFS